MELITNLINLKRSPRIKCIKEAPNEQFLLIKVVAIFGIAGGCRRRELYSWSFKDVY